MLYDKKVSEALRLCSEATGILTIHQHYRNAPRPALRVLYQKLRELPSCFALLCAFSEDSIRSTSAQLSSPSLPLDRFLRPLSKAITHVLSFLPSFLDDAPRGASVEETSAMPFPRHTSVLGGSSFRTDVEGGTSCVLRTSGRSHDSLNDVIPLSHPLLASCFLSSSCDETRDAHHHEIDGNSVATTLHSRHTSLTDVATLLPQSSAAKAGELLSERSKKSASRFDAGVRSPDASLSHKVGYHLKRTRSPSMVIIPAAVPPLPENSQREYEGEKGNGVNSGGWDLVIGCDEAKSALKQCTVLPRVFPQLFQHRRPLQRILLYGPPGTGKTLLAKAVAEVNQQRLFSFSAADLLSQWVGESEKRIQAVFRQAVGKDGGILFFDEIDALCGQRGGKEESESARRVKTQFLLQLQCLPHSLTLIAATNVPWDIDTAIRRRFDRMIYVGVPEKEVRCTLIQRELQRIPHSLEMEDIVAIAGLMEGFTASDVVLVTEQAIALPLQSLTDATAVRVARPEDWIAFGRLKPEGEISQKAEANKDALHAPVSQSSRPCAVLKTEPLSHREASISPNKRARAETISAFNKDLVSSIPASSFLRETNISDDNRVFFVPCSVTDPMALLSVRPEDLPGSQLLVRLVSAEDFRVVLESFIPSVTSSSVQIFKDWKYA